MSNLVCSGYEVITVGDTVMPLTATKITPATGQFANQMAETIIMALETDAMRYSLNSGITVSATVGTPMAVGDTLQLSNRTFRSFTAHRVTNDAKLHVHYFHAV